MKSSEATVVQFDEKALMKLTPQRLKALKIACYKQQKQFYCERCRDYHPDMMESGEKEQYDQLNRNLNLISKVQSIKGH